MTMGACSEDASLHIWLTDVSRLKACMHAHTRTHTHAHTRTHTHAHTHTHTRTHSHTHTHTRTHTHTHARTHAHTHTRTHARTHIRMHARAHTHTYTHTYTHTHTHTHTCISAHKAHTCYKRAQSTHKLPVHSAKGFANFSASLAMLPPTCLSLVRTIILNLFFTYIYYI